LSERGVFAVDRGIWDHPIFQSREPFSRREAWLWLISSATWKAKSVFVDRKRVQLKRGQLAFSIRFLAEQWGWSKSSVGRFLDLLKSDTMIEAQAGQSITIITICKYDEYQKVSLPSRDNDRDESGTQAGQSRDKEESREDKEEDDAVTPRVIVSKEARDLADELCVIAGHSLDFVPPGWCGAALRVQAWLTAGWPPEIIIAGVRGAAVRKRGPPAHTVDYFENAVAELFARQSAPVPIVEIREASKLTVYHGKAQADRPNRSLTDALHRELAELEGQESADNTLSDSSFFRISN